MAEKITIARPYANALFELAQKQGSYDEWSQVLSAFADVVKDPKIKILIEDPSYTSTQIINFFAEVKDGDLITDTAKNLLKVLADNDRLFILPEIDLLFKQLRSEVEETLEAEIISAKPLSEDQLKDIATALKRRFGREIRFSCRADDSILGGAVVRVGDLVIDGSATGKLKQLASALFY
ncbi:F0F1 ATP synthase subunit delta [Candidatus Nitrosoglobus terrae]|uniref:ATP synthase subunit delta n=1 Tax=Candidatus Nitrosoglobus terrae TaxID=1630141 RepID=A0A1Q2SPY3_9GAMM|nr:F0F1 ATP synthase subunit delta [Candidatus Nitrosoglobus terrae]BAW81198.1 F0F1 ATP synthase subunit delta [Candidatus Nitrosoglobus terrae]